MRTSVLFCRADRCTGCLLCEMACSLALTGRCGREQSAMHILTHPLLGISQPVVSERCALIDCEGRCVQSCTAEAIRFVPRAGWAQVLSEGQWVPVPVLPERR